MFAVLPCSTECLPPSSFTATIWRKERVPRKSFVSLHIRHSNLLPHKTSQQLDTKFLLTLLTFGFTEFQHKLVFQKELILRFFWDYWHDFPNTWKFIPFGYNVASHYKNYVPQLVLNIAMQIASVIPIMNCPTLVERTMGPRIQDFSRQNIVSSFPLSLGWV